MTPEVQPVFTQNNQLIIEISNVNLPKIKDSIKFYAVVDV